MGTGNLCQVPQAAVRHGTARQNSGTGQCWDYIRVLWDQYSGKGRFIGKPGVQEYGGRHVAERSSDPRVANPEVKVQVRDLVRAVVLLPPSPHGGRYAGKNRFIEPQGVNGHWRSVLCVPSCVMSR